MNLATNYWWVFGFSWNYVVCNLFVLLIYNFHNYLWFSWPFLYLFKNFVDSFYKLEIWSFYEFRIHHRYLWRKSVWHLPNITPIFYWYFTIWGIIPPSLFTILIIKVCSLSDVLLPILLPSPRCWVFLFVVAVLSDIAVAEIYPDTAVTISYRGWGREERKGIQIIAGWGAGGGGSYRNRRGGREQGSVMLS